MASTAGASAGSGSPSSSLTAMKPKPSVVELAHQVFDGDPREVDLGRPRLLGGDRRDSSSVLSFVRGMCLISWCMACGAAIGPGPTGLLAAPRSGPTRPGRDGPMGMGRAGLS